MTEARQSHRRLTWAPKALAVLSCALALLAAQPAGATTPALRKGAVVVREAGLAGVELPERVTAPRVRTAARETTHTRGWRDQTLLGSARHWRILATMEIFHRLLISEVRGAEAQAAVAMWVEQAYVGMVAEPVIVPAGRADGFGVKAPSMERAFAIRHCLLAPPIC
jgi:hypothetical protein